MADYFNPTSLMPQSEFKASGPLGGMLFAQQMGDYRQAMEQQMFLQELAKRRAIVDTTQREADAPLLNLQRQGKMEKLSGEMPFLAQQAGETAQTDIAGQQLTRGTKYSPEARTDFFDKMKFDQNDRKQKQFLSEVTQAGKLANDALEMSKAQGQTAAIGYLQQQMRRAREAGLNIPDHILNPQSWEPLRQAGVKSAQHLQKMEELRVQGDTSRAVAGIQASGGVEQARIRADMERNQNPDQRFAALNRKRASGQPLNDEEIQEQQTYLSLKWATQSANMLLNAAMSKQPLTENTLDNMKEKFFKEAGYPIKKDNKATGIPAGSKKVGKTPSGKDVWEAPDGKRYTEE